MIRKILIPLIIFMSILLFILFGFSFYSNATIFLTMGLYIVLLVVLIEKLSIRNYIDIGLVTIVWLFSFGFFNYYLAYLNALPPVPELGDISFGADIGMMLTFLINIALLSYITVRGILKNKENSLSI